MNERQRRFCSEYVKDRDAPRAAAAAGYTGADAAKRLLARGDIRAAIAAADADAAREGNEQTGGNDETH